jgi:pilus assembly protein TadC
MGMTHIRDLVSQTNNERNAKIQLCLSLAAFIPSLTIIGYFVGGLWEASGNGAWYGFLGGAFIGFFLPSWLAIRHAKNAIKELETAVKDLGDPQQDSGLGDAARASVKASK